MLYGLFFHFKLHLIYNEKEEHLTVMIIPEDVDTVRLWRTIRLYISYMVSWLVIKNILESTFYKDFRR